MRRALASGICAAALLAASVPAAQAAGTVSAPILLGKTSGTPVTVSADPVGLSIEYPVLAADLGSGPCPPPALVSAISGLGAPTIRIGGDSEDQTAPPGAPQFSGVTDLPTSFWSQLACLESQTHEPFVVGLNLASQIPAWAAAMAAGARSAVPANLLGFEIGNEADIDGPSVPWWNATAQAKTLIPFNTYLDDAEAVAQQIGPGSVIEGPDFATPRWLSEIPQIASALSLHTIDTHFYPLNACTGAQQATVAALLRPGTSELSSAVEATLAQANSIHLPMLISESNSVACRGKAGVSDSAASAVWGLRLVINALRAGIVSVRFHSSGSSYDPFVVDGGVVTLRPLYEGLETAVQLLPVGAVLSTLRTPSNLMGVAVDEPGGGKAYIVTSYASRPVSVELPASGPVKLLRVQPAVPVIERQEHATPSAGMVKLEIWPNTVVAVTPS
ncbi:MAG: hypothetical protein ABSC56_02340 [Solirubrobacteraceae bacterium]